MAIPRTFIRNVALKLHKRYQLDNTPFAINRQGNRSGFIGRQAHKAKFLKFLHNSSRKGVFLVTGYRGMGKTSFVNHVVDCYIKYRDEHCMNKRDGDDKKRFFPIHLTLAQNKPKEVDILRLMVTSVFDEYKKHTEMPEIEDRPKRALYKRISWLLFSLALILPFIIWPEAWIHFFSNRFGFGANPEVFVDAIKLIGYVALPAILVLGSIFVYKLIRLIHIQKLKEQSGAPWSRIKWLMERTYSMVSEEGGADSMDLSFKGVTGRLGQRKRAKQYPIATTKEIEYELQLFLKEIVADKGDKKGVRVIFIFDELDKVEPAVSGSTFYNDLDAFETQKAESAYQVEQRDRRQAIVNIIAGLKNFFTSADARFIFIAGREMFDASLADIADRQSSISSIFTYTFNIESFLKKNRSLGM